MPNSSEFGPAAAGSRHFNCQFSVQSACQFRRCRVSGYLEAPLPLPATEDEKVYTPRRGENSLLHVCGVGPRVHALDQEHHILGDVGGVASDAPGYALLGLFNSEGARGGGRAIRGGHSHRAPSGLVP